MYNSHRFFSLINEVNYVSDYIKIAHLDDIKPDKMFRAKINGHAILLANIDNEIYAVDDMCTHEDASLYNGALKGHCVECPLHGSHFDFRTGEPREEPATEPLKTYQVKIQDTDVYVQIN